MYLSAHGFQRRVVFHVLLISALAAVRSEAFTAISAEGSEEPSQGSQLLFLQMSEPPQSEPASPQAWQTAQVANVDQDSDDPSMPLGVALDPTDQSEHRGSRLDKNIMLNLAAVTQKSADNDSPVIDQMEMPTGTQLPSNSAELTMDQSRAPAQFVEPSRPAEFLEEAPRQQHQVLETDRRTHRLEHPVWSHRSSLTGVQLAGRSAGHLSADAKAIARPSVAAGKPDIVNYALYGKTFYGVDLREQEFTIDSILTLQWIDARTIAQVPQGQEELTLAADDAADRIWTPKVEITNRIERRFDRISSSVTIGKDGKVTKVERTLAVIKNKLLLNDYPFDKQTLRLNIASTQYMLSEVVLQPLTEFGGLRKGFFDGEDYVQDDFRLKTYDDVDASLKKSRGSMEIDVSRSLSRFHRNFLLPAIIYMSISCAVFWLPFSPTFVTPRLALSIFILLVFSNLAMTADSELPPASPYNWVDLMCFTIQLHMFSVVCLNIFTEIAYHSMKCTVTAVHISNELKLLMPLVATISLVTILAASHNPDGVLDLHAMTVLMPVLFLLFMLTYMTCCGSTLNAELARNRRAEQIKSQEYGGGGMGPLSTTESLPPATNQ